MKFSIIIPVYNVEKYLAQCLDSVLNQTYNGDYEIICVNDGSTDSSLAILKEYKSLYSNLIIINSKNNGTASARNIGIQKARGEYLWFIDSDDWIVTDSLQILSDHLSHSQPDVLCFNGKLIYETDGKEELNISIKYVTGITGWEYYNKYALQSQKFHFVCVVLRIYQRQFLLKNNLFFECGILHEDNLWVPLMCYYAQTIEVIPETLYVYRIRQGSKMSSVTIRQIEDTIKVANRLAEFFIPKTDIDKTVVYREIAGEYFSAFLPEQAKVYGFDYKKVNSLINWESYRTVSQYPRHKRIYRLISISPKLFHLYLKLEKIIKNKKHVI